MEEFWIPTLMLRKYILPIIVLATVIIPIEPSSAAATASSFQAEVWVDNWFSLYINGKKVGEDSTPYNTERSFNSTLIKFSATYPFQVGVLARDFMENASGLEYIGKPNQQIGDAGFVMQIREIKSGKIVAATNSSWKSLVIQKAPLNSSCSTSTQPLIECKNLTISVPALWSTRTYKDTSWKNSTEYTEAAVGVKDGYSDYVWGPASKLIWSSDLKLDNTVLFRTLVTGKSTSTSKVTSSSLTLASPDFSAGGRLPISYTCDGAGLAPTLSWSGVPSEAKSLVLIMNTIPGPPRPGESESSNHAYLVLYNIPTSSSGGSAGKYPGTTGMNFKDKTPGYTPPCSQGPGDKTYTFTLYALSSTISLTATEANEVTVMSAIKNLILEKSELSAIYARA
jgi:phosphatidylethanolamine-binding protein (PEBP) family uncharacterized protein